MAWQDFLQAVAATGFTFKKQYQSVWQFTSTVLRVERAMNFHGRTRRRRYRIAWRGDMLDDFESVWMECADLQARVVMLHTECNNPVKSLELDVSSRKTFQDSLRSFAVLRVT